MPKAVSDPYRGLASAILLNAIKEYKRPTERGSRYVSQKFFVGEFFETCCWLVDLNPHVVREQLKKRYGFQYSEPDF